MNLSIKNKILLHFVFTTAFVIGIYSIITFIMVKHDLEMEIENRLLMAGKIVKENIKIKDVPFFIFQGKVYEAYFNKFSKLKNIIGVNDIFIIDSNKNVLFSLNGEKEKFFIGIDSYEIRQAFAGKETSSPFYIGANGRYFKTGYIPLEGKWVIGIEASVLYEKYLKKYANLFLTTSVIAIFLSFIFSFIISKGITRSIVNLKEKAEKLAKKEFDEEIKIEGEEEIKILADAMNEMRKELKNYIENKEKMATLGEFSAGVAHEMRNNLSVLSGYAELILERTSDEKISFFASEINKNVLKLNDFLNNFLTYTKEFTPEFEEADIKEIINSVIDELKPEIKFFVQKKYDVNDKFLKKVDIYLFKKAIYNLIINAYQALTMPEKKDKKIEIFIIKENEKIKIIVKDNGVGIDEKIKNKIFQPFVSGKKEGVGLGLAITYRIIKEIHNGEIFINSKKGEGTEVIILL
jgi:signal transduction histidine kinase